MIQKINNNNNNVTQYTYIKWTVGEWYDAKNEGETKGTFGRSCIKAKPKRHFPKRLYQSR